MKLSPYIIQRRTVIGDERPVIPIPGVIKKKIPEAVRKKLQKEKETIGNYFTDVLQITRPPKTEIINVTTSPTPIAKPPHMWPYLVLNPSLLVGLASSTTLFDGTQSAAGNTQANPLGVANYMQCHFHLDVTAITGTWDFYAQSRDPYSGRWADTQVIFQDVNATGTYYTTVGTNGIVTDLAIRWNPTVAGSITFSITATLKDGSVGTSSGLAKTIFIGGKDVTTESGLPLFEGDSRLFFLGPEITLYAVAYTTVKIKVFTL